MNRLLIAAVLAFSTSVAMADLTVKEPWVRATVPQQTATGAFMQITAPKAARLVEARSPVAGVVQIHEMSMSDNVMRMREVAGIDLPAGKAVDLKPGGYHVMLMDLKAPIAEGQVVPLTLVVEHADKKRENIEIKATARPLGATGDMPHKH
ncbi:MAG TPA: copper chaperone PCu(A)C [Methyloversatilis sp.]